VFEQLKGLFSVGRLKAFFGGSRVEAKVDLPSPPEPRGVKAKQQILPSYLRSAKPNPDSPLPLNDPRNFNADITALRVGNNTWDVIRDFVRASPDLSAAVTSYIRTGVTNEFTVIAKNLDGTVNEEGTIAVAQIMTRMNILNDYSIGYDDSMSIRSLSEAWAKELMTYGAMAGELVLNRARLPDKIQPVSVAQIRLFPSDDGKKLRPVQVIGAEEIDLDIPTFFMVSLDQDVRDAYAQSPIESAIQSVLFSADFMNDIRRIVKRAIHPRLDVSIDEEKFRKAIPEEYKYDQNKLTEYMNSVLSQLEQKINGLDPEDAMVHFDSIGIDIIDHGNTNLSNEYKVIQELADAKMATGAKVLPTVLGKSNGTSNVASAEVLMFVKYVEGSVWGKLNEMFSKIFTLAARLMGHDVYVEFQFAPINLRPESELEAFKSMKQSRILDLLSLGMITDAEAAIQLTGHLPPQGYKPLSGTMFRAGAGVVEPAGNGYNGATNSGSTMNQNLNSDAPTGGARGQNKKAAEVIEIGVR
jgi:hypothetical protein